MNSSFLLQIITASAIRHEVFVKYGNRKWDASHFNSSSDFLFGITLSMIVMVYINYDVRQRDKSCQDVKRQTDPWSETHNHSERANVFHRCSLWTEREDDGTREESDTLDDFHVLSSTGQSST